MWLLDANVPKQLAGLLSELGVPAETAQARGWGALDNGTLVGVSVAAGFTCLLTRDRLFGESAGRALEQFPEFAVIVVTLPQARSRGGSFRKLYASVAATGLFSVRRLSLGDLPFFEAAAVLRAAGFLAVALLLAQ